MNTNMKHSIPRLIDLPDELLLMIFKNLNNVQLLYSLLSLNIQLHRILSDSIFTKYLTLFRYFSNDHICSLVDKVLDRFCLQILPQIHDKINLLNLESSSMERILLAADYPNLHGLGIYNVNEEIAERVFAGYLNCHPFLESNWLRFEFGEKTPLFFSSTLIQLHINVASFEDCLCLLDGRLNQLIRFFVNVGFVHHRSPIINCKEFLPNMKCFSLMCQSEILSYKKSIVPLLRRMTNLEKLALYISVNQETFLDGNNLKNDIINHFSQLNKFIYNIRSLIYVFDQTNLLSNDDLQHSLMDLGENEVISYVDYFPKEQSSQCHYFSYPYTLRYYDNITNNFPGGLFKCVREVSLFDERPFEHEFFIRIAQAFPLLEKLSLVNLTPQKQKLNNNNNEHLLIIEYLHLVELDLLDVHDDYIEQFLVNTKTSLLKNICLWGYYDAVKRVTHNFKRKTTRINCAKIKFLRTYDHFRSSKRLTKYFPNAKVSRFL